jgi:hypothetical protein
MLIMFQCWRTDAAANLKAESAQVKAPARLPLCGA